MVNNFRTPQPLPQKEYFVSTSAEEYDFNFCFEVPSSLKSNGVELVPLIPSVHGQALYDYYKVDPVVSTYLAYGPFTSLAQFLTFCEERRQETGTLLFAIKDLSLPTPTLDQPHANLAGFLAILKGDNLAMIGEIGHINILTAFHRSHITTHSVNLLQKYLLDDNSVRRCLWFAHSSNLPSVAAAKRLNFTCESVQHWAKVLPPGKVGIELPEFAKESEAKAGRALGRHDALLVINWVEWRESVKAKVEILMNREVVRRDYSAIGR